MKLRLAVAVLLFAVAGAAHAQTAAKGQFTEWGWPQPYERVSAKSIEWMKSKGWWPVQTNFFPATPQYGMPTHVVAKKFAAPRGVEISARRFASGPAANEALISGHIQLSHVGNFPFFSLVDKNAPIRGIFLIPNERISVMVPLNSPLRSVNDLKGKTIGTAVGSGAYMALVFMLRQHGLNPDKDVSIRNLPWPEQLNLPSGIDAVAPWDMGPSIMMHHLKNARELADLTSYDVNYGMTVIRSEIIENAPDIAQAIVDALLESVLFARWNIREATEISRSSDTTAANYPVDLVSRIIAEANAYLKPTWTYPHMELVAQGMIAPKWMKETGRLTRDLSEADFKKYLATGLLETSYKKLGWKLPDRNPIFEGSRVQFGVFPYKYRRPFNLTTPEPFPAKGDLTKPWYFAGQWHSP
jgi:sulfonate transport system substrate-binding protein